VFTVYNLYFILLLTLSLHIFKFKNVINSILIIIINNKHCEINRQVNNVRLNIVWSHHLTETAGQPPLPLLSIYGRTNTA